MKSVRLFAVILVLLAALVPAVFLRSAYADAPAPSMAQLNAHCERAIRQYIIQAMVNKEYGVTKDQLLEVNKGASPVLLKLIDAIYDGGPFTAEDMAALMNECVQMNLDRQAKRI